MTAGDTSLGISINETTGVLTFTAFDVSEISAEMTDSYATLSGTMTMTDCDATLTGGPVTSISYTNDMTSTDLAVRANGKSFTIDLTAMDE